MSAVQRPGRVVMLVDNTIDGDSRVQKSAEAMAEEGWEVHLIGRAPGDDRDDYAIGRAQVHRLPLLRLTAPRSLRGRLTRVRYPLAYPTTDVAMLRRRRVKVDYAELEMLRGTPDASRAAVLGNRVSGKVRREVTRLRGRQTRAADQWGRGTGLLENAEIRLWHAAMGERSWRRLDPTPLRYEFSYRALIEEIDPDLIHAHDFRMVGVAARAVVRARRAGRTVRMVYDAHEFVPGLHTDPPAPRWLAAQVAYEREHIGFADAVVTVSPALAELLQESHGLPELPLVTLNAPPRAVPGEVREPDWTTESGAGDVREACGLGPGTPLAVYCGNALPERGLHTLVEALQYLPGLHLALVTNRLDGDYVASLRARADELGVAERLHLMPYVPYYVLVRFLATATVGIHPLVKGPINHEVALSTKFFEFMQAGLPVVVSDVKAMADEVERVGMGEVFRSGDAKDLARALGLVLGDRYRYTAPYDTPGMLDDWSWEAQTEKYAALYRRLLPDF